MTFVSATGPGHPVRDRRRVLNPRVTVMAKSKAVKRDRKQQLLKGIGIHFAKAKTITLKGKDVKVSDIVAGLDKSIAAASDTDAKRVIFLESAKTSRQADAAIDPTILALTEYLQSTMGASALADFDLQPKTRSVPDVATKAEANKKRAATRKARGTMGKKQRAKIVGVVEGETPAEAPGNTNGTPKAPTGTGS
jgi:hypothetical protein